MSSVPIHTANVLPMERLTVLVVDPDDDTRELYKRCFELAGSTVIEASDGRDALTKALVAPPSLVVTELRTPFIDGAALCDLLRADSATSAVPILVVTADCRPAQLERAKNAGADAVLTKPTPPDTLLDAAKELLQRGQGLRDRSTLARTKLAEQLDRSANLLSRSDAQRRRTALCKSHARVDTTTPPLVPPALMCPSCDTALKYDHSHIGGVSERHSEQWDYYECAKCGTFQYRQRTRKVRRIVYGSGAS